MPRRVCLVGFLLIPGPPQPVTIEFWDTRAQQLIVAHDVPASTRTYQHYFPDDYFLADVDDLQYLFSDEIPPGIEVVPRFGDRNPMKVF